MQTKAESALTPTMISENTTIERQNGVVFCNLNDEAVLLDLASGVYFGLNQVGASIWRLLETPRKLDQIGTELQREYEIDAETCGSAVRQFVTQLASKGLITLGEQ